MVQVWIETRQGCLPEWAGWFRGLELLQDITEAPGDVSVASFWGGASCLVGFFESLASLSDGQESVCRALTLMCWAKQCVSDRTLLACVCEIQGLSSGLEPQGSSHASLESCALLHFEIVQNSWIISSNKIGTTMKLELKKNPCKYKTLKVR